MTAAHATASSIPCPNCHAPKGHICTHDGHPRAIPCHARTMAADRAAEPPSGPALRVCDDAQ